MTVRPTMDYRPFSDATGYHPGHAARGIEAVDAAGVVRGQIIWDDWTPASVRIHVWCPSVAAGRALIRLAYDVPFRQLGRQVIRAVIASHNTMSLRIARHAGFREVHRTRDGWAAGSDLVHLEMRRFDCKCLPRRAAA